jgi:hypothetical protein
MRFSTVFRPKPRDPYKCIRMCFCTQNGALALRTRTCMQSEAHRGCHFHIHLKLRRVSRQRGELEWLGNMSQSWAGLRRARTKTYVPAGNLPLKGIVIFFPGAAGFVGSPVSRVQTCATAFRNGFWFRSRMHSFFATSCRIASQSRLHREAQTVWVPHPDVDGLDVGWFSEMDTDFAHDLR